MPTQFSNRSQSKLNFTYTICIYIKFFQGKITYHVSVNTNFKNFFAKTKLFLHVHTAKEVDNLVIDRLVSFFNRQYIKIYVVGDKTYLKNIIGSLRIKFSGA